jgi:hypothetical protein
MAAQAWKVYAKAKKYIGNGTITLGAGVFKMMLLRNSATTLGINALSTTSVWSQISAAEINAVGGYAANGRNVGPATGLIFTASGASLVNIRFAAIRNSTGAGAGKLLCYCSLSSAAFSIVSPNTLTITPNASGVFTLA